MRSPLALKVEKSIRKIEDRILIQNPAKIYRSAAVHALPWIFEF